MSEQPLSEQLADITWKIDPAAMASNLDPTFQIPKHVDLLSRLCAAAGFEGRKRILVNLPPGHGKSHLVSLWTPTWYLSWFPKNLVMLTSYESDFAISWGRKVRDSLRMHSDKLGVSLAEDSKAAGRWHTKHGGGMVALGTGGAIMGRRPNLMIVDDPVKSAQEANSAVERDRLWEWWQGTARDRLEPDASIVLVMHRWHPEDLCGRLIAEMDKGGEQWDVFALRAIAEEDDPIGREVGEALWPERFSLEDLEQIRIAVGSHVWESKFQQRPANPEGGEIKRTWWQYFIEPPAEFDQIIQSWDFNIKSKEDSDFTVGQVWGRRGAAFYLLDQIRGQMDMPEAMSAVNNLTQRWPQAKAKLIEDAALGPAIISMLRERVPGMIPIKQHLSKTVRVRAQAVAPVIEARNVYLPKNAAWVGDFIEEASAFPNGAHDDQVDAMSQALTYLYPQAAREMVRMHGSALEGPPPQTTDEIMARQIWKSVYRKNPTQPVNSYARKR
jgi:predicted phage terminase large subunit-like protein